MARFHEGVDTSPHRAGWHVPLDFELHEPASGTGWWGRADAKGGDGVTCYEINGGTVTIWETDNGWAYEASKKGTGGMRAVELHGKTFWIGPSNTYTMGVASTMEEARKWAEQAIRPVENAA